MNIIFENKNQQYNKNLVLVGTGNSKYNISPNGETIGVNQKCILINNRPTIPVMGEFQYSRYKEEEWEKEILKMKRCGLTIIASYCFWIHHEEEEGEFNFNQNRNIRKFIKLCQKHDLYFWPRIGPWCNGECRNGGYPDWLLYKNGTDKRIQKRVPDNQLHYVERLYKEFAKQMEGLFFYQGGPIIGVQIDNEYPLETTYLFKLKEIAVKANILAPIYSITGWGSSEIPESGFQPMFGAYPAAPWARDNTKKLPPMKSYIFSKMRSHDMIDYDNDLLPVKVKKAGIADKFPFTTCEVGTGIHASWHRRPLILPDDAVAISYCLLGSGNNLPGYYMFHGGIHPVGNNGKFTNSAKITGRATDCAELSYDFQAAIGEFGQIREQYHKLRFLHSFLHYWGSELSTMSVSFSNINPKSERDFSVLRCALRGNGESAFLFYNNYVRGYETNDFENIQWSIDNNGEKLTVPEKPITICKESYGILPINLKVKDLVIKYALVQPLLFCKNHIFFVTRKGLDIELVFAGMQNVDKLNQSIDIDRNSNRTKVNSKCTSFAPLFSINNYYFHVVDEEMAKQIYCIEDEYVIITDSTMWDEKTDEGILLHCETGKDIINYYTYDDKELSAENIVSQRYNQYMNSYILKTKKCPISKSISFDYNGNIDNPKTYIGSDNGCMDKCYTINLPKDVFKSEPSSVMISISYEGAMAEVYIDNVRLADNFYIGNEWEIDLMRFKNQILNGKVLNIRIKPLTKDQDIYFDIINDFSTEFELAKLNYINLNTYYETRVLIR